MRMINKSKAISILLIGGALCWAGAAAAESLNGRVLGGGKPVANSTVTLWAAGPGAPQQLAQAKSDFDGRFSLASTNASKESSLYLVAAGGHSSADKTEGGNPAIALMSVLGEKLPASVTINELTTIASVLTHNQFVDGAKISGSPLALRIAAGNVPNFVDLVTGGYGTNIQDGVNSTQTPTMANFATLGTLLAGCTTRAAPDACEKLFAATTSPAGAVPADTLAAAEAVIRNPGYKADRLFALLDTFYPVPQGKKMRVTPYLPYLTFAPSA